MSNDAVLDPTVHHLFAEDRFNKENSADYGQGKIQQITATIPTMPFLKPRSLASTMPAISGGRDTRPSLAL
jgi:hypothetical protein